MTDPTARRDRRAERRGRLLGYALTLVVMACVAGMSWSGLYSFGRGTLHWAPLGAAVVPVSLDVAATACTALALDTVRKGDSAALYRFIIVVLIGMSAWLNWWRARETAVTAEEVFFPTMSVVAWLMAEATVRKYRRDAERDVIGTTVRTNVLEPIPHLGVMVWLTHPVRAWGAVSTVLERRIPAATDDTPDTRPGGSDDESTSVRTAADGVLATVLTREGEPSGVPDPRIPADDPAPELEPASEPAPDTAVPELEAGPDVPPAVPLVDAFAAMSQADAVRTAARTLSSDDARQVTEWLTSIGVHVDTDYARRVLRKAEPAGPNLTVVNGRHAR